MSKQKGFSLIEVMVVVAIIGLLVLVTAPLTGAWVQDANILDVEGDLTQAVGRAKASALRNQMAARDSAPVTAICISQTNLLTVLEGTSAAAPNCDANTGTQVWSTQLDADIDITAGGNTVSCMCFDNKGFLTAANACAACATTATLQLSTGNNPGETVYIF